MVLIIFQCLAPPTPGSGVCECGIANNPFKIAGGVEAEPHEYPWNVYILFQKEGGWYKCGGALLDQVGKWATSACCENIACSGTC